MHLKAISAAVVLLSSLAVSAQVADTAGIYGERRDSLSAAVATSRQSGNYLARGKDLRTEVISSSGLRKLACCSLADSFENSASVTVGYADATTGARQIRLLGLSGIYTQMLDEARPTLRGISSPFGLTFIPGSWMGSIQIAKGATSVVSGAEAMTGSINVEHRKPTDEKPFFLNGSIMSDTKADLNAVSSLQFGDHWSTVLMGHVSGNFKAMDMNGDGFVDDPKQIQYNISNRWLYFSDNGTAVRFGVKAVRDSRQGGQMTSQSYWKWTSDICNSQVGAYVKVGIPTSETGSVALVADYTWQDMNSTFGARNPYSVSQHSGYVNLMWQDEINARNKFTVGASAIADFYDELYNDFAIRFYSLAYTDFPPAGTDHLSTLANGGLYGEYTYHIEDRFSIIAGLRADMYSGNGVKIIPRLTARYSPGESLTIRANGGRGLRFSNPLTDNIGVFSTNKLFLGDFADHTLEDAWIFGGNITWNFGGSSSNYFSLDYFHTDFSEQEIVDYGSLRTGNTEPTLGNWSTYNVDFYKLSDIDGGRSYTDNWQADLAFEPFRGFTVTTTFRYTDARTSYALRGLVEKPKTSRYKGVINLQYATRLNKWIFDGTLSVNGPCRVYGFMEGLTRNDGSLLYPDGLTPTYPLLYLQVTRRMKGWDFYIGGENLTGFTQENVVIGSPAGGYDFDASQVWGPIMGARIYAGFRFTIWKTS